LLRRLLDLRISFRKARAILKSIGNYAGVDIEPEEQTELINATEEIDGVLCSGVPGAGGRDAIFCLTYSPQARLAVEKLWSEWGRLDRRSDVCPLLLSALKTGSRAIRLEPFLPQFKVETL
jgi:phosphomevalonate kinase